MPLPHALAGLRVLDLTRVFAGPLCTQLLADLGAEVLKVERPGSGDDTRAWGPPFAAEESAYFLCLNRGKRSLELDLSTIEGRKRARDLASAADVLVENFATGWLDERELGWSHLRPLNPRLVYLSLTGHGRDGPDAALPGYDFLVQGRGGFMAITGEPDGVPMKVGVAVADLIAGLYAAVGILAALRARDATGEGTHIDLSLLDCQVSALANVASNALVSGSKPARYGNAHPNIVPYEMYEASDGPLILAVGNDAQWSRCCALLGRAEWASDPLFATNAARVSNRARLTPEVAGIIARRPRAEWLDVFRAADVPAGPVQTVAEVLSDPQVLFRGMLQEVDHPSAGPLTLVANPLLLRETPLTPPPRLGEGGEELAERWLAGRQP